MSNKSRTKIYFLLQDKKYQAKNVLLQEKTNKNITPSAGQKKEYVLLQDNKLSYKEFCVMMNRKRQPSTSVSREVFKDKCRSTSMS